jgi:hypothetical protein
MGCISSKSTDHNHIIQVKKCDEEKKLHEKSIKSNNKSNNKSNDKSNEKSKTEKSKTSKHNEKSKNDIHSKSHHSQSNYQKDESEMNGVETNHEIPIPNTRTPQMVRRRSSLNNGIPREIHTKKPSTDFVELDRKERARRRSLEKHEMGGMKKVNNIYIVIQYY